MERIVADFCDGVGDSDAGQAAAARERIVADACDGVGNDRRLATRNPRIARCFDDSIAIIAGVVISITTFNSYHSKTATVGEFINLFLPIIYALNDRKVMA